MHVAMARFWSLILLWPVAGFDLGGLLSTQHAVDELTDRTFSQHMKDHPVTAILFYAPWCFFSQQVMPAWDQAAQKLEIHDPPIRLAKVDTSRYASVGEENEIHEYPTMKLFVDGTVFSYDGQGRGWQQIVKWVNRHLERDHVLKSVEDAETYLHDNELAVVGLFPDGFDSSSFVKAATHYDDIVFAEARGQAIATEIADHLGRHARLLCETITVGQSSSSSKEVTLPRDDLHCDGSPRNPQRPEWTDKFEVAVQGKTLTVKRTDQSAGWGQLIQIKCCDDEKKVEKEHPKFPVPSVVMFFPYDERYAIFEGDLTNYHALDKFINGRRTPTVMRMDQDAAEKIFSANPDNVPALIFITDSADSAEEKVFREAAMKLRGRVHACISGTSSLMERRVVEMVGDGQPPLLALVEVPSYESTRGQYHVPRKYRLPLGGATSEKIVGFVSDFEGGRLKPWLKSEAEPSAEDMKVAVVPLVGTTFTAGVEDESKDVLVDFFAPWCGHCRKFEPLYKELAKNLRHVKSLKIAKIDATRNEVEGVQITGFPTIILFPAGKLPKRHVMYHGSRQPEDMIAWLQRECSIKFDAKPPPVKEGAEAAESGLLDPDEEDL
ncbi:unnamed protein product [Effrenium voratum]|uniref:Thioredoxin domain-containing protein n=1 Tax=Effrenium voratum TaxID=2562239 RepID=A0AA36I5M5_9DINO|nr:unnamed protein product [Effrenium voratum]CAJ1412491.1 unnamed protein product [Effrenium voratum]CAJ1445094.1 unnamed protein product [Effrenium voratum]